MAATSRTTIQPEKPPPTENSARYHSLRVYLQVRQWMGDELTETDWGWSKSEEGLAPIMNDQLPAPDELWSIISCNCRSDTQNPCSKACSCKQHGIQCMSACGGCHGVGCSNSPIEDLELDIGDEERNIFDIFEDSAV